MKPASRLWIGTSGWAYKDWRGSFFPDTIPMKDWLRWYAAHFATAEINGSFYRTPSLDAVKGWRTQTPENFVFAWKASKFITHWKRLKDTCRSSLDLMETRLRILREKAGPVLFQLPPQFKIDRERLASFLKLVKRKRQCVFEFRHPSWYAPRILTLLSRSQYRPLPFRPPQRPRPMGSHRRTCLYPWARTGRAIQRSLSFEYAAPLGRRNLRLAATPIGDLLLFRQ